MLNIISRQLSLTSKLGNRHISIKFRYGPQRNQESVSAGVQQGAGAPTGSRTPQQSANTEAIWDFQIPTRWRRAPISEEECAVINNGGPL